MAKSKRKKVNELKQQVDKAGQHRSKNKYKEDAKLKKAKPEDHLQHIPFRLREIMKSKNRMKTGSVAVKKLKKEDPVIGDIRVPHFKRGKRESVKSYLRRMENETKHVLFLTKNQVERRPELDPDQQEQPSDKGKSDKKKEYAKMRLNKLQLKKLDRQEDKLEKEMFVDNIPFGEVTLAPPSLSIKPRKAQLKSPNTSKKLLLSSLLGQTAASTAKPSMARQRVMEEERLRAVEAYRQLKKQKQQKQEAGETRVRKLMDFD
ncbi:unnamed protein product [Menidia menidia]|uniref:(Atlantic silverside) hypothetical protein n=1 Tax=Menidia menidia TaxID=238744 RepID=A0A8S4AY63_9TELE|nr:unnamed protein product [Menidia menidia]